MHTLPLPSTDGASVTQTSSAQQDIGDYLTDTCHPVPPKGDSSPSPQICQWNHPHSELVFL